MYTDSLILRQLIVTGLTTKGSELTADELDTNFKLIWQDLGARLSAGALPDYNPVKNYSLGNAVKYGGFSWVYVYATPTAGTDPGSDPDYWTSVNVEYFAHQQNTDTKLAEGTADEVSAAELRAFVDAGSTAANLGTVDLLQTDIAREYDIDGGTLTFSNGQVIIGAPIGTDAHLEIVNGSGGRGLAAASSGSVTVAASETTGTALSGGSDTGIGVSAAATGGSGVALFAEANLGVAGLFRGGAYIETFGVVGTKHASAVLEAKSTTQGLLPPRMTTAQRNAIVSPATGLVVDDSTTNEMVRYNGSFWGASPQDIPIFHAGGWTPTGGQSVAFGSIPVVPINAVVGGNPYAKILRGNRVIRGCDLTCYASGVAGSGEAWSLYIRINGTTDYLVATVSSTSAIRNFTNQALNIPYVDGDNFRMIFVNPLTWATVPTAVLSWGNLKIS